MNYAPKLRTYIVHSNASNTIFDAVDDCFKQIHSNFLVDTSQELIIGISFFSHCDNQNQYILFRKVVNNHLLGKIPYNVCASFVCQTPASKNILTLEITILENYNKFDIIRKQFENQIYTIIQNSYSKYLIAFGINTDNYNLSLINQYRLVFKIMQSILHIENLSFDHVLRQWNYIENITKFSGENGVLNQNYQIFNDVRTEFYQHCTFVNGYPAATGIGTTGGGLSIDFIAYSNLTDIYSLKSPVQLDAHRYSDKVLENNILVEGIYKSTPKFERAKYIKFEDSSIVYISGTAAIIGEESVVNIDTLGQTKLTLENILAILSEANLKKHGINKQYEHECVFMRVYVKYSDEGENVKSYCQSVFKDVSINVVVSDVCRDNLLVEIEAVFIN